MELIYLLLYLLIGSLILYLPWLVLAMTPFPNTVRQIVWVILLIIVIVWIIQLPVPGFTFP